MACSTPETISAERSGASNWPAACARQLPRAGCAAGARLATGSRISVAAQQLPAAAGLTLLGGLRLVAAARAHLLPGAPIRLRMHLGLGEPERVAQPLPNVLERVGLWRRPGIPVRPVAAFDRVGQRFLVAAANPMHPKPGMLGDGDQRCRCRRAARGTSRSGRRSGRSR